LRAGIAWRALSWIAETTGHPEEAFRFAELAALADPTDPGTLYQRGRLLAARGDFEGARDAFQGALDQELDFVDAARRDGGALPTPAATTPRPSATSPRALELDDARAEVHALRGWNQLEANDLKAAQGRVPEGAAHPTRRAERAPGHGVVQPAARRRRRVQASSSPR
jgi:tetratricopeptide (TPR) repeat protein